MKVYFFLSVFLLAAFACGAADEETIVYQPMNSGVEIIFNADGSDWQKMKAIGLADLKFGDRTDVRQATKKAVLRAKADLTKFMKEKITSKETSEEITKLSMTAKSDGKNLSEDRTRKIVDTTIEKIVNDADAILKGIIVLESNVNKDDKYVRVVIGVSRKTIAVADSLKANFSGNTMPSGPAHVETGSGNTVRRSSNYDNF